MELADSTYLPVLRWKEAERAALAQIGNDIRRRIAPIVEFVPKEFNLDALATSSANAAMQLAQISGWGRAKPVLLDFHLLGDAIGARVVEFLSKKARAHGVNASLVTGPFRSRAFQEATKSAVQTNAFDVCLRVYPHQLRAAGFSSVVTDTLANLEVAPRDVHLVLDFGNVIGTRPNVSSSLDTLSRLGLWKSTTVLLGAFPKDLSDIEKNTQTVLSRSDWITWRDFVSENPIAPPFFGDYTIQHGQYEEHEGQHFNFSASIRYTSDEDWIIMRGEGVLTEDGPGYAQWPANAQLLCERDEFSGGDYCAGDRYIETMAQQTASTGTSKEWLSAGINHHISFVVRQFTHHLLIAAQDEGGVDGRLHEET